MTQLDPLLPETQVAAEDRPAMDWPTDPWDAADSTGSVERLRRQTRPFKWVAYTAMVLMTVIILIAGAVGWWYLGKLNPPGDPGGLQNFTVAEGVTFETLTDQLMQDGYISDEHVWEQYVDRKGGLEIVPGFYQLRPDDHMGNVLARLRTPPAQTTTSVTFPEGFTIARIARRVDSVVERMNEAEFLAAANDPTVTAPWRPAGITSLEGLLFPDTYSVSNADSEAQLVGRMIDLTQRVAEQEDIEGKAALLGYTPYEALIVASLIEREAKTPDDRAKISRVILNRLAVSRINPDDPFLLQIDASVYYGRDQAGIDPNLKFSEVRQIDTPWNTYTRPGLPLTPIASPGRASIRAALNPAPNPSPGDPICAALENPSECYYFYYVLADADGNHAFAATGEQHDENVARAAALGLLD